MDKLTIRNKLIHYKTYFKLKNDLVVKIQERLLSCKKDYDLESLLEIVEIEVKKLKDYS